MECLAQLRILINTMKKMECVNAGPSLVNKGTLQLQQIHNDKNLLTFQDLHSQAICQRLCLRQKAFKDHPYPLIFQ